MTKRRWVLVGVLALVAAVVPIAVLALQSSDEVELDDAEVFFEINSTDGDAGIQVFLDGEGWGSMKMIDPGGNEQFELTAAGGIALQGLTEFFFESAEPSFDEQPLEELLARFPEGVYTFEGTTVDGDAIVGEATLTHDLPAGPVTSPADGSVVDPANAVISWEPVTGVEIVSYQVIVEQEEPLRVLSMDMPADATSVSVPPEFLLAGTQYKYEVLAKEASGNQTITEQGFETE